MTGAALALSLALAVGPPAQVDLLSEVRSCTSTLVREHALRLECEARPPVVKHRVPEWAWLAGGAAVLAAFAGGVVLGLEAGRR